ncbi:MAG: hypothetical protein ACXABY_27840 [Candidatus Thorarchaeota archaeon]|jgi:co-chaperonin GroES (HSP10)
MELRPTADVIVLRGYKPPKMSDGGIALPENVRHGPNEDKIAEVLEVGDNVTVVKAGDKVAWTPANATAVNFGQNIGTLYFVEEINILAHIIDGTSCE